MAAQKQKKSSKKFIWVILAIVVIFVGAMAFFPKANNVPSTTSEGGLGNIPFDFDNQSVLLNNENLVFVDGLYQSPDGQNTAQMTSRYANESGTKAAVIMVDSPAGSGTFSYLIGASSIGDQAAYSAPILLGDRIAIDSVTVDDSSVTVDYLTRPDGAPMTDEPTEIMSVTYTFQPDGSLMLVE